MGITFEYNPQMVFMNQIEVEDLGNYNRGGFGSTGEK